MDSRMMQSDASLNAPVLFHDEGSGSELQDYVAQEGVDQETLLLEFDETEHRHGLLMDALSSLNEREQDILKARRLKETPETLEELSHKFGVSRERVRQIEARAMEKLQQIMLQKVAV
jgi:RNA polymerase sigma-32 factor